jgi:hypothetical protein
MPDQSRCRSPAAGRFSRDESRAGSDKGIQHDTPAVRAIPDSVRHHGDGFYRRMQAQIAPILAETIDPMLQTFVPVYPTRYC